MAVSLAQRDGNTNMLTEPKHKSGSQIQQNQRRKYSKLSEHIRIHKHPVNWVQHRRADNLWKILFEAVQKPVLKLQIQGLLGSLNSQRTDFRLQCWQFYSMFIKNNRYELICYIKQIYGSLQKKKKKKSVTIHFYSSSNNLQCLKRSGQKTTKKKKLKTGT